MSKTIFKALVFCSSIVIIASLVMALFFVNNYFEEVEAARLGANCLSISEAVEKSGLEYLSSLEIDELRITWISHSGDVIFDNKADITTLENHANREEFKSALLYGKGESYRYSSTLSTKTLYSSRRLSDNSIIRLSVTQKSILNQSIGFLPYLIVVSILTFTISTIISRKLSKRIIKPLNELNLDNPLANDTYDEITPLLNKIDSQQREIKRQLEEASYKKSEFKMIVDNMSESLILLDKDDLLVSLNNSAKRLFNIKEYKRVNILTLIRDIKFQEALKSAKEGQRSEYLFSRDNKEYSLIISKIVHEKIFLGTLLLFFDISEKKENESLRREFSANVSHELKTPLQSILAYSELLKEGLVRVEDQHNFILKIYEEANRLVTLIQDIISLSQLDEAESLPKERVNSKIICDEIVKELSNQAEKRNITINSDIDSFEFTCVRRLIYEIIYNLIDNSIRYNVNSGSVELSFKEESDRYILRVKDTGIGIEKKYQDRIFERFFRVDKSHSRQSGGTGLGLSIVKHALAYHNANYRVESELSRGTTIECIFYKRFMT